MKATLTRIYALIIAISALVSCATPPITLQPVENQLPPTKPGVYDTSKVDVQPFLKCGLPLPVYPAELRVRHIAGECVISFTVKQDGSIGDLMVVRANDVRFGTATINAVSQWQFIPARLGGQPVDCRLTMPIKFQLPGN